MRSAFFVALFLVTISPVGAMQESIEESREYVRKLPGNCAYNDGYRCIETRENDFLSVESEKTLVPGKYLEAWLVCLRDFREIEEMDEAQKQLKHYKIGFTENEADFIILFRGLLLPALKDGEPAGVMRATFGLSTKYWVDKETLEIRKRLFLR